MIGQRGGKRVLHKNGQEQRSDWLNKRKMCFAHFSSFFDHFHTSTRCPSCEKVLKGRGCGGGEILREGVMVREGLWVGWTEETQRKT
jgi:hypothetical protein